MQIQFRFRAPLAVLGVATIFFAGCGGGDGDPPASIEKVLAYNRPATYGVVVARDTLIPMRDGFKLTCDVYRPAAADGAAAPGRFAGIVANYTAYGRTFKAGGHDVESFVARGYAAVWCNVRGSNGVAGMSPAPSSVAAADPWGPQEQQDNYDLIEWMAAQPWSTGNIGQIGGSYGGISTLLVAGRQQPPHLKAIIPIEATPNIYADFAYQNGMTRAPSIPGGGDARNGWINNCSVITGEPTCSDRLPAAWSNHPSLDAYWAERTFDPAAIRIPTLTLAGFRDFWVSGLDRLNNALADRSDFSMLIGPWAHEFPELASVNPITQGVYLAWFDRHLLGNTNAPQFPKMSIQGVQDAAAKTWRQYDAWPPKDATLTRFYLAANGGLSQEPVAASTSSYAVAADGSSGEVSFATPPFQSPRTLAGQVKVTVPVTLTAKTGNLIAEIFDRAPDGTLVSLGYPGYQRVSQQPNVSDQVTLTIPSNHWTFGAGHRMELAIKSADKFVGGSAPAGTVAITGGPQSTVEASFR